MYSTTVAVQTTLYCTVSFGDAMVALCHCSEPAAAEASSSGEEDESLDAATQRLAHASRNPGGSTAPTQSKKLKPAAVMRKKQKHEGSSLLAGWVILECPWDIVPYSIPCPLLRGMMVSMTCMTWLPYLLANIQCAHRICILAHSLSPYVHSTNACYVRSI